MHHRLIAAFAAAVICCMPMAQAQTQTQAAHPFGALEVAAAPVPPGAATATYFGTTTLLFKSGDEALMIDGFFSRPGGPTRLALGHIKPKLARIDKAMTRGNVPRHLNAVLVAHTHHDHSLDSAVVACLTTATLVGTPSLRTLQQAQLPAGSPCLDQFMGIRSHMSFGAFEVDAIEAEHAPTPLPLEGKIEAIRMPAHASEFRLGGNYSYLVKVGDTHALVSSGMPTSACCMKDKKADVVFLSIGGLHGHQREYIERYWKNVVMASGAKVVVPTHWDDFTEELRTPLPVARGLFGDFRAVMCQILALAQKDQVAVRLLPAFDEIELARLSQGAEAPGAAALAACKPQ